MRRLLVIIVSFAICLSLASCESFIYESQNSCTQSGNHTVIDLQKYRVMLFGPNDEYKPDIWEGPVCIENKKNGSVCEKDLSLIKEVKQDDVSGDLIVSTFSGSNERRIYLDMDSCKIAK
ncbi:hypothetical protein [Aliikangiella sp. IMCC44359]|uniref:hypothetical protein n=1 Tax=Aliikangiella sp. IMCC44359 TaxID=3459125 RepID=UPI00403AD950